FTLWRGGGALARPAAGNGHGTGPALRTLRRGPRLCRALPLSHQSPAGQWDIGPPVDRAGGFQPAGLLHRFTAAAQGGVWLSSAPEFFTLQAAAWYVMKWFLEVTGL